MNLVSCIWIAVKIYQEGKYIFQKKCVNWIKNLHNWDEIYWEDNS